MFRERTKPEQWERSQWVLSKREQRVLREQQVLQERLRECHMHYRMRSLLQVYYHNWDKKP